MGSGVSKTLLPNAHKRAKTRSKRQMIKDCQQSYEEQIIKLFSSICEANEGTLDRDKVRKMCEILFHDIDPQLGLVTEEDVDEVMMIGEMNSKEADHHITVNEIPKALSTIMAIKKDKQKIHDLFLRHDVDGSKCLSSEEISELLSEINDGIIPSKDDIQFIIDKCGGPKASVDLAHLKPAIEMWYVLVAQGPLPTTVEEAKAAGYTDAQIAEFVKNQEEGLSSAEPTPRCEEPPTVSNPPTTESDEVTDNLNSPDSPQPILTPPTTVPTPVESSTMNETPN
jgi:Ca2+-binding EF-hand superfamily protein